MHEELKHSIKKYFDKYFNSQFIKEGDREFKALVRMLAKQSKLPKEVEIENGNTYCPNCLSDRIEFDFNHCPFCGSKINWK